MADFKGTYYHTLDSKSRMVVPAAFREDLGQTFVIMKSPPGEKCLSLYPLSEWQKIKEELDALPASEQNRKYYRWFFARIDDGSMDPQNRVNLKEQFRSFAGIEKNIAILGSGRKIEIWDEETWRNLNSDNEEELDFDINQVRF